MVRHVVSSHNFKVLDGEDNSFRQAIDDHHNQVIQERLLDNLHPDVVENIRKSLQLTFVNMLTEHTKTLTEIVQIEQIEARLSEGSDFWSW